MLNEDAEMASKDKSEEEEEAFVSNKLSFQLASSSYGKRYSQHSESLCLPARESAS